MTGLSHDINFNEPKLIFLDPRRLGHEMRHLLKKQVVKLSYIDSEKI